MSEREEVAGLDAEAWRLVEDVACSLRPLPGGLQQRATELLGRYDSLHPSGYVVAEDSPCQTNSAPGQS